MLYLLGDRKVELRGHHHYIAPSATVVGRVILEDEASIWFHVVVRGDSSDRIRVDEPEGLVFAAASSSRLVRAQDARRRRVRLPKRCAMRCASVNP